MPMGHLVLCIDGHRKSCDRGHVNLLDGIESSLHFVNSSGRVPVGQEEHRHEGHNDRNLAQDPLIAPGREKRSN